jgi:hypothetical protein
VFLRRISYRKSGEENVDVGEGGKKYLMIYVNHDNKNAEAKNIPHSTNLLLFIRMEMP